MKPQTSRLPLIDMLKALASQLIVLHHLAFYGPMSDVAYPLVPAGIDWLYDYARIAVQVFLVVAGFLAARALAPEAQARDFSLRDAVVGRYCRLALPLIGAVGLCILAAALARQWMSHESIPDVPTLWQFLSHALLLQGILDQDSLSAGVWYVAIDFQLFAAFAVLLALTRRFARWRWAAAILVSVLGVASLFHFNLDSELDDWWIYFFGAYAMGAIAQWAGRVRHGTLWILLLCAITTAALVFEFRSRIAVALCTALLLAIGSRRDWLTSFPRFALTDWLSRISYSVFLVHFSVCLLVNTVFSKLAPTSAPLNLAGMLLAWFLSIAAGHVFHHFVESRVGALKPANWVPKRLLQPR